MINQNRTSKELSDGNLIVWATADVSLQQNLLTTTSCGDFTTIMHVNRTPIFLIYILHFSPLILIKYKPQFKSLASKI